MQQRCITEGWGWGRGDISGAARNVVRIQQSAVSSTAVQQSVLLYSSVPLPREPRLVFVLCTNTT